MKSKISKNYLTFLRCYIWTRRNFSLVARYSLKVTPCLLLVVKSLVTRCRIRLLIVAEVARCKKITRYLLQNSLVYSKNQLLLNAKNHSSLFETITSPYS